jgi:transposase
MRFQARAVKRRLERRNAEPVASLRVDERSFTPGHHYFTMLKGLDRSRVLFVAEHRSTSSLDELWSSSGAEQIGTVQAVAMDMWDLYITFTRNHTARSKPQDRLRQVSHCGTFLLSRSIGCAAARITTPRAR